MKSNVAPVPSTRDFNSSSREDAPPKKRARGRPLKGVGQSTIPEVCVKIHFKTCNFLVSVGRIVTL
jgi:hypothetical protein